MTTAKTRLDAETVCPTCAIVFTIHGIDQMIDEVGSGYNLGGLECPNCGLKELKFDIQRVEDNGFVLNHRRQVHEAKLKQSRGQ